MKMTYNFAVVFSDATLIDMAEILPTSYGEMLAVIYAYQRKSLISTLDPFWGI